MRHYEVLLMVHPDQSDQVGAMIERYTQLIGTDYIHRLENIGRRLLSYPIQKLHKLHYVLLNFECNQETLKALKESFQFNRTVIIRYLLIQMSCAVTTLSMLSQEKTAEAVHHERPKVRFAKESRAPAETEVGTTA
jgi:small subunit ribosomal protein S6